MPIPHLRAVLPVLTAALVLFGCDMPTESPSFSFDTKVKSPLLYQSSYQLLGSSDGETNVLIDTTAGELDTLFESSGSDNTISVTRSVDDFGIGSLDDVIPDISVDPVSFSVSGRSLNYTGFSVTFTSDGSFSLEAEHVSFPDTDDYVALDGGTLVIEELVNEFDVDFDHFSIEIPALRKAPYGTDDGVRITFSESESAEDDYHYPAIEAGDSRSNLEIPLDGLRLVPTDGEISYELEGETENITDSDAVSEDDEIRGTMSLQDLSLEEVQATVASTTVDLTGDSDGDGQIELDDDGEAEVAKISGLGDLKEWFSSLQLTGTELELTVQTNVPAEAELYAAIRGTNADGETVYLQGKNDYAVESGKVESGIFTGETGPVSQSKLIKIPLKPSAASGSEGTLSVVLDGTTSNVDEFLNNLPSEIRFVGQAQINPEGPERIHLTRPIALDASLEAYLPLRLTGEAVTVQDTMDADFSALQDATDSGESLQFKEGTLEVTYDNGLPVGADLKLEVLDRNHQPVGVAFGGEDAPISIESAPTENGFAATAAAGMVELTLSEEQLGVLDQGRYLKHELIVRADEHGPVSLRADDTIDFSVRGAFEMRVSTD